MKISELDPLTTGFTPSADMLAIVHAGKTWRIAGSDLTVLAGGPYIPTSGGPVSGPIAITHATDANLYLTSSGAAPGVRGNATGTGFTCLVIEGKRSGAVRWNGLFGNNEAESTGNLGSNFSLRPYNDAGTALSTLFQLNRTGTGWMDGAFTFGQGSKNSLTITPGAATFNSIVLSPSGTGPIQIVATTTTAPATIMANTVAAATAAATGTALRLIGATASDAMVSVDAYGSALVGGSGVFLGRGSQGTPTTPTAVVLNQRLLGLHGAGYGSVAYSAERAAINFHAAQAFTAAVQGTYIAFLTTPIGGVLTAEQMRLTDAGVLQIGVSPENVLSLSPGAATTNPAILAGSGTGGLQFGASPQNALIVAPGANFTTPVTLSVIGSGATRVTGEVQIPSGVIAGSSAFQGEIITPGGGAFSQGSPDTVLDLNFLGSLPPGVTFTRNSAVGTYYDVNGVMQTVSGSHIPRFDYDPVTHAARGLMIEVGTTNMAINSSALTSVTPVALTATAASGIAPDGTNTAVRFAETATTTAHYLSNPGFTIGTSTSYACSIHAKAGEVRYLQLGLDDLANNGLFATFDLLTGTISGAGAARGTGTFQGAWIVPAGNGYWRCIIAGIVGTGTNGRFTAIFSQTPNPVWAVSYAGNTANGLTAWGVQIEAGLFPSSYIATGATGVSRQQDTVSMSGTNISSWYNASTGTVVGEVMFPFVTVNVLTRLCELSDGTAANVYAVIPSWPNQYQVGATAGSVSQTSVVATTPSPAVSGQAVKYCASWGANRALSVNGGAVASTPGGIVAGINRIDFGNRPDGARSGVMYLKRFQAWQRVLSDTEMVTMSGTSARLDGVYLDNSISGDNVVNTRVVVGAAPQNVLTIAPGATVGAPATIGTSSAGTRMTSMTRLTGAATTIEATMPGGALFLPAAPDTTLDLNFLGMMPDEVTFTRASANATYYDRAGVLRTAATDAPRFDYDPATHALKGLLIEETRTNTIFPSTPTGAWPVTAAVLTVNSGIAPDGTNTLTRLAETATTAVHFTARGPLSITAGAIYSLSIYAKAAELRYMQLGLDDTGPNAIYATFDLLTGTISAAPAIVGGGGAVVWGCTIQPIGNGVYRCSLSGTVSTASVLMRMQITLVNSANPGRNPSYLGVATNGLFVWGGQFEPGAFPTSLIQTTSATGVRAQDNASVPVGSWYDTTKGSLQIEYILVGGKDSFGSPLQLAGANANTDYIDIDECSLTIPPNAKMIASGIVVAGVDGGRFTYSQQQFTAPGVVHRGAASWALNGSVFGAHDGFNTGTSSGTVASLPVVTNLAIGAAMHFQSPLSIWVRRVGVWARQLSLTELGAVTSTATTLTSVALDSSSIGETTPGNGTFVRVKVGSTGGPTWTTGSAVPTAVEPNGSLYSRVTTWAAGATLYVSKGGGAWTAVASV